MPRYYFDFSNGHDRSIDTVGLDLADHDAACREAVRTLPELLRDGDSGERPGELEFQVRDEGGRPVLQARLSLAIERFG